MKKKQIWGMIIAAVLFIIVGISSVLTHAAARQLFSDNLSLAEDLMNVSAFAPPEEPYIGIVHVEGTIQEQTETGPFETVSGYQHLDTMDYIDNLMYDENNAGILLYVDSPGGNVYESEELYDKLREYSDRTSRPIWTYMSHFAASGGYMISLASDKIYANRNTITGSIGVIMSGYDLSGLYEKLGIRYVSITSGENKDSSLLTDSQIAIYQTQVDECFQAFVEKVCTRRNLQKDKVLALADGRTYSATQAKENGLIDEISSFDDMCAEFENELNVHTYYSMPEQDNVIASLFSRAEELIPKSEAQVLSEQAAQMESGVLMYYAEQLY